MTIPKFAQSKKRMFFTLPFKIIVDEHSKSGLLVLAGVEADDGEEDLRWLSGKLTRLRIFDDENGVMNLDVRQVGGEILVVSQFTLHASTRKGNRPSYIKAAPEAISRPLYERFAAGVGRALGREVAIESWLACGAEVAM